MDLVVGGQEVIPAPLGGEHTQGTLCQDRELFIGQVWDFVGREPQALSLGLPQPCSSSLGTQKTFQGISQDIPLCPPPLSSLFLLLALLLPHHLRVSCHIPGLSLSSCRSITPITSLYPSAHPWGISSLTPFQPLFQALREAE